MTNKKDDVATGDPVAKDTTEKSGTSVVIDREKYVETRSATGAKSLSNGDPVALALAGLPLTALFAVADKAFKDSNFAKRYSHLNPGMQRMNLGNRLRGFVTARDKVNDGLVKEGKEPKASGIDAINKWCAPFHVTAQAEAKAADVEKAKQKAEKAESAAKAKESKPAKAKKDKKAA